MMDTDDDDVDPDEDEAQRKHRRERRRDLVRLAMQRNDAELLEREQKWTREVEAYQRRVFLETCDDDIRAPEDVSYEDDDSTEARNLHRTWISITNKIPRPENCAACARYGDDAAYSCDRCRCGCFEDSPRWLCPFCCAR